MKKFFTLICAAIVALSASADFSPVLPNREAKAVKEVNLKEQINKSAISRESAKKLPCLFAGKNLSSTTVAKPARIASATQDYTPSAPLFAKALGWDSYSGDGSWSIQFYAGADTSFYGSLELVGPSTAVSFAGTYTTNDTCYVVFVRAQGDTLYSDTNDETFTVSYVSETTSPEGDVYTTYHVQGDLSSNGEVIHMDFDFQVVIAIDYLWYYAYYVDGSVVGVSYPLYMYCQYLGQYCEYESYCWITLLDKPVIVLGDTVEFYSPYELMPEFKYFDSEGVNRLVFRANEAVVAADTLKVFAQIFFSGDELEASVYNLEEGTYNTYNKMTIINGTDTTSTEINVNENSTLVVSKSNDETETFFELYLAARDGKVYHTTNSYYIPTEEADTLVYDFQYTAEGWSVDGANVDTTYLSSDDGDVIFGAYGLELTPAISGGYSIEGAYYLELDVKVADESYIGSYTIEDILTSYSYFYNTWDGYQLAIIDINFEIQDSDMDGYGDVIIGSVATNDGLIHPFIMDFAHPDAPTTALQLNNADVKVEKVIKNGQLIIRKGDKEFNVLGAQL